MGNADQEKLFSPSQWSKRFDSIELIQNFVKLAKKAFTESTGNTHCSLDVPYGSTERTKYDIYGTDLPDDAPIFVFVHGGYWQELSKDLITFPVEACVTNGIKVVCPGYDLCPKVQIRDIVGQIRNVTETVLGIAAKCGSRGVWVGGHSAGAHLSASLLDPDWLSKQPHSGLLKGLILLAGIYYLEPLIATTNNRLLKLDSNEAKFMSSLSLGFDTPVRNLKVIVAVGECDSPAFIEQSRKLVEQLHSTVDNVEYILLRDNVDHFDIVEKLKEKNFILTKHIVANINFHLAS